jgi:hypothetical protein
LELTLKARHDNASGLVGATWNKADRKWQSQIFVGGRNHYLGQFNTPEAAHAAAAKSAA